MNPKHLKWVRLISWIVLILATVAYGAVSFTFEWSHWIRLPGLTVLFLVLWYIKSLEDRGQVDPFEEYTVMIKQAEGIGEHLSNLASFLRRERQRIQDSETALRHLLDEKTKLEPVVLAQKETVNAILAADARTMASRAWRERALGFVSGLIASLVAATIFESLRR